MIPLFRSFQSTVTPFERGKSAFNFRVFQDPITGAPVGLQTESGNGPDGIWTPIDLTAAQIASPDPLMLADLNATYRLDEPPYTRYVSTGAALVVAGSGSGVGNGSFYAPNYGGTWDATHDVGVAVNAAIAAAVAAGGGTVIFPAGTYGLSTPIVMGVTGTHLMGQGVGASRDNATFPLAVTRLLWIGAANGTMLTITPSDTTSLYSMDVEGITFDANDVAGVGVKIEQVTNSVFRLGVLNARSINIWLTTRPLFIDGPGNQNNDFWLWSANMSGTHSPTGILIDGGTGATFNTSFNRFHLLWAWYAKGDGVVFGWGDNNIVTDLITFQDGAAKGGTPVVFANSAYVAKNGIAVNGSSVGTRVLKTETSGVVTGYQASSTVTRGVHGGTAALTTVPLTTNGTSDMSDDILHFASTTNVLPGMVCNAVGGWSSGIAPNTPVLSTTGTTVRLAAPLVGFVASGLVCTFSYGITRFAAVGTYTMTAVDGTHWSLAAASGGHNETNVLVANGAISFTDMVIPLTGTPNTSDTFTIVVPYPARNTLLEGFNGAVESGSPDTNHIPLPMVEPGGMAFLMSIYNPFPTMLGGSGDVSVLPQTGLTHNTQFGGYGNIAGGAYSTTLGGLNCLANGFASSARGQNAQASGIDDVAEGGDVLTTGVFSRALGSNSTDRGRYGAVAYASGAFTTQGDAQTVVQVLRAATTNATVTRLTSSGLTASPLNTVNLPAHSTYRIGLEVTAHQTGGSSGTRDDSAMWTAVVLLKQGALPVNTVFVGGYYVAITTFANTAVVAGTGFTPTVADAAAATWTITLDVDVPVNGGLAVSGTGEVNKNIEWLCRATSVEVVN